MKKVHYSWIILPVTFLSIIVAGIIRSSSGVFIDPFELEFGWSRPAISFAFAVSLFLYGFSGPFMAAFVEVFGLKRMMLYSMLTLSTGLALTFVMQSQWQLILIWGVMIGIGSGLFLTVLSTQIANRWFVKHRGLAVGILTASTATGQLILLPVLATIIDQYSWRYATGLIFILSLLILLLILLFMKDFPQDKGLLPYGQEGNDQSAEQPILRQNPFKLALGTLMEGLKLKEFWLLAGSFFICGLSTSGLIGTHFISYCIGFGIPVVTAAAMLSFMGVFDLVGTTLSGWLSDRIDNRWLLFWYYVLRGISLLFLPFALAQGSYLWLVIFSIFYGLDWIATVPPTIGLARREFGLKKSTLMYGWIMAAHQVGAGVAAFGGGVIFKVFGSYQWAFILAGSMCVLASLFVIMLKKHQPKLEEI
ncbi:MFS transporter [Viridibacillus sp. FSL R5-0477]|uniref:Major facilitator superfamily protein n=1 Tax=Viridibacillus arenosi FSL R5-213 TaxID=1227360 RepID=W4EKB1_9BACL|nr:MFS transporter [Viridibacillus arenosi]ETT80980.1 major facilitator superfamily protein [Viridibacillus arenosi FSL R5-213]OMC93097.1 MFS transporter [Viridibacillus arenosi]